ncbi:MAG TPA: 4Fe-4S dicluster domain-containing protein [Candidatus Limnocylindrales bacterium]|nr:4Fe-4S dicluster domain-containing protein [Candidatus Limnocylindrales bacterium]
MTALVDTNLLSDLQRYGAADVSACFSCGTCTATCPLVSNDSTFPRRMIRYAQVGLRDRLLSSKELWTCYACGECSETCPTQAEPSEFMAAARRYAIAGYDRTGLARTMYTRPVIGTVIAVVLAAFFALFMYAAHGPQSAGSLDVFRFIPEELIHNLGIAIMVIVFATGLVGVVTMARAVSREGGVSLRSVVGGRAALRRSAGALWTALAVETLGQRRYRDDCDADAAAQRWYLRRWFLHAATMWGFLGLLAATILDYGLAIVGIKATGTAVPIWYPVRLLGTVAGILLVYGATMLIVQRYRGKERSVRHSTSADWTLLALVWITGVTGFALELALYLPSAPAWGYWVFLFHVAIAMELVILAPFMKLAHAVYRPVALFFLALAGTPAARIDEGGVHG